jgi:hypothetical protein
MEILVKRIDGVVLVPAVERDAPVPVHVGFPRTILFKHRDVDLGAHLEGQLSLDEDDHRYRLHHLEVTAPDGITSDLLRTLAVGRLIIAVVKYDPNAVQFVTHEDGDYRVKSGGFTVDEQTLVLFHLAHAAGENTNVVVAEQLGVSSSAAAQRIARLRKRGWLPPATKKGARR